jgi:hypothetical protein
MQETLRQLREQWKQADQGAPANHGLWKKFDDACNAAHKVVESWLEKVRAEGVEHRAQRMALIEEVTTWAQEQGAAAAADWKAVNRALHQFGERWRAGGHVSEKVFAELQPLWKQALGAAAAPLETAQKASLQLRQAMIAEAEALGAAASLRIDAIKALQQRWQAEAQSVPLDRKHEQRLWDAFRKPIDDAFNRKTVERERSAEQLSARDRAVLDASKALEAASASGDAQQIRAAMAALELAIKEQAKAVESDANQPQTQADQAQTAINSEVHQESAKPVAAAPVRPVVAVRGDDRPGMRKAESAQPARAGRPGSERRDARDGRGPRDGAGRGREREAFEARGPRLGDTAFRAQRDAMEHAQTALRKLAAQAHGEALTQLMAAWKSRDAEQLPTLQELGGKVSAGVRAAWGQAIAAAPAGTGTEQALLRLEMAADVPTPADQLAARRALQLQMLTRRNDPAPAQTWAQDAAQVLAGASDEASARRLQSVLKVLLRK